MALLDLSLVTRALVRLVEEAVSISPAWLPRPMPTVSPQPPDQLGADALGVYLYHLVEAPHTKGAPPPAPGEPPVRFTPMGLDLHYQLATGVAEDDAGAYQSQLLLGLAVKALHDYPTLTDTTAVNGPPIFETVGLDRADNRIRLTLEPLPAREAVSFWTAGTAPLRLAAYYQASVVMLEPERTTRRAGRVLTYGVHTFVSGAPRLEASENRLTVAVPGVAVPQQIALRPAEVPIGGEVSFAGVDLAGDGDTFLVLRSAGWNEPRIADMGWGVIATPNRVRATVAETVDGQAVIPGLYSAAARVERTLAQPGGGTRTIEQTSNAVPFTITPRIDLPLPAPSPAGVLTVTGRLFAHPDLPADEVAVYLGTERLAVGVAGALNPAEFAVVDAETLEIRLAAGAASGDRVPLRVVVRGAESPPLWIAVP